MSDLRDLAQRMSDIVAKGQATHPDFDNHAGYVVGMAKSPNDLREALAGMDDDDAHRIVSHLATEADPDDASDILGRTGQRLGAALGKIAAQLPPKATPAPQASAQAKSPDAPSLYDSKLSTKDWAREYDRQQATKRQKRIDDAKGDRARFGGRRAP